MPDATERDEVGGLLAIVDRYEALMMRSELIELEVESGPITLRLAKQAALAPAVSVGVPAPALDAGSDLGPAGQPPAEAVAKSRFHAIAAPLTGIFYSSPSPGAAPYVKEGAHVSAGQVIGLIEAMKLFNEIKSDVTGTVRSMPVESGALVKQRQTLLEVEPS